MSKRLNDTFLKLQSEEQYRSLSIENSDEMIISLSRDGNLISVNAKFEENVGKTRTELMGRKVMSSSKIYTTEKTGKMDTENHRNRWKVWKHTFDLWCERQHDLFHREYGSYTQQQRYLTLYFLGCHWTDRCSKGTGSTSCTRTYIFGTAGFRTHLRIRIRHERVARERKTRLTG